MFEDIDKHLIELQEEYESGDRTTFPRRCIADLDHIDYTILSPYINKLFKTVRRISQNQATTVTIRDRVLVTNEQKDEERWEDVHRVYLVWTGNLP